LNTVTLPGMRPNFPNAETKTTLRQGILQSPRVNTPMVPVGRDMGVNFGRRLIIPAVVFRLAGAFCGAEAAVVRASLEQWRGSSAFVSDETEDEVSPAFLGALGLSIPAGLFAKPVGISNKTSVSIVPTRKINRIITSNLRPQISISIHANPGDKFPHAGPARNIQFFCSKSRPAQAPLSI